MPNCQEIADIIELNQFHGNVKKFIDHLYNVFQTDLSNNELYFNNKIVRLKRYPPSKDINSAFHHLTCKDFYNTGNEENRKLDLRRCERLHWIKPVIVSDHQSKCPENCFKQYKKTVRGKERLHLFSEHDRYMIVLEEKDKYFLLVTAYYIEYDNMLNKKRNECNQ